MNDHPTSPVAGRVPAEGAAPERSAAALAGTVTARFLAVGGAHVTVDLNPRDSDFKRYVVTCESCGKVGYSLFADDAEKLATEHAEACRRIPQRLWPENTGGAR